MNLYSLCAPQLGEGVKDVKVVAFLKNLGDTVSKDEPLLLVETQKATMEIESPVTGIVHEYKAPLHGEVAVGKELITIRVANGMPSLSQLAPEKSHAGKNIPLQEIVLQNGTKAPKEKSDEYDERLISNQQYAFLKAMRQSSHEIPALIQSTIDDYLIRDLRKNFRTKFLIGKLVPTSTEIIAWCVLQAMQKYSRFRSTMLSDDKTIRQYKHASIGIAVGLPDDGLATVRISDDEYADFKEFITICKSKIAETKTGINHNGPHSVSISDLTALNIHWAMPVIVSPAVATLCIGKASGRSSLGKPYKFSLAFDHRLINGVGAARFLFDVQQTLKHLKGEIV